MYTMNNNVFRKSQGMCSKLKNNGKNTYFKLFSKYRY